MLFRILYIMVITLSLLTQLPSILESGLDQYLKLSWLPLVFLFAFMYPADFVRNKTIRYFVLFVFMMAMYCSVMTVISDTMYWGADMYNMALSLMITFVSYSFGLRYLNKATMSVISIVALGTALYLSYNVYYEFLYGVDIMSKVYAFDAKNSMSTIILSIIVIGLLNIEAKSVIKKGLLYFVVVVLVIVMFLMKSRATLVGFFFILGFGAFCYPNRCVRQLILLLVVACATVICLIPEYYDSIVNGIILVGRDSSASADELSSGRVALIQEALKNIELNFFFGNGDMYLDCMPIAMVLQFGIIGASVVFAFLAYLGIYIWRKADYSNKIDLTAFLLFGIYILNSLFEAQPPFGPGIKGLPLWMMVGFFIARKEKSFKHASYALEPRCYVQHLEY